MAKNIIEKQKGALIGIAIAVLVLGLLAAIGGIILVVFGALKIASSLVTGLVMLIIGAILVIASGIGVVWSVGAIWLGASVKATKGSIADTNIAKAGTVNGKVCPKCGCTNTPDSSVCAVCGAPLDASEE